MPDELKESWRQMVAEDTGAPIPGPKVIDPNAQAKLAARDKAADPFAGLEEVGSPAAKQDPFSGLQEVKSPDAFSGLKPADALDLKDTKSLVDDDTFRPADYLSANPNLRTDEAKSKKLIDVYRARQERGLQAGKVVKAAVKEAPGIVAKTAKGVRDLGARIIEAGIQPAATSVLAAITGATPEEKSAIMAEQGKEQLKAAGEVTAGTESAITGLAQLGQQGARKVQHLFGKPVSKMTDSELLDQLYLDSEFAKTTKEVAEGRGDLTKAAGLDADTLAKNGVTLDKEAIEHLSLVDPLTLVATAGVFKVVGLGGRVIATAATKAGATAVINGLAKVAQTVGAKGVEAVGKAVETAGKTVSEVATRVPAKSVGFVLGATKTGTLQGGAIGAAAGEAAKRIGVETAGALAQKGARVAELGSQLKPGFIGPKSAGVERLLSLPSTAAGQVAKSVAGGAVQGAVTALPLAAAADESETAGALLGGGAALGAIHGAVTGTKSAVAETVAKNYLDPHNIPFEPTNSPAYGVDAALDKSHDAAISKLPESDQNAVNTFREAVRAGGGEIYVQDGAEYLNRIRENLQAENGGKPLTPEQESQAKLYADTHAFFDGGLGDRRVVFLNGDSAGLNHDAGHLFQSMLSPENQSALRESALSSYSPEQLAAFKEEYAKRIGEPDYFSKLGSEADAKAADELIAENFSQLFQNQTLDNLSAPRPFLTKLADTAVKAGEALGFDLTAGRTTADLGAKPSFRLQDLLRNAAQDVLTREPKTPAPVEKPLSLRPEDVARREKNVPVTKETLPEVVKPVEPSVAKPLEIKPRTPVPEAEKLPSISDETKNIRAERTEQKDFASQRAEDTGIAEAQKATESTPEVRKVVDDIAASMNKGNPVLEVEHRGIVSERGPANPEGRTSRRGTQEAGYQELEKLQIENRAEAPESIVNTHQKTFVPVRFTTQGGKPTLIAMSLDKVIANVRRVVRDAVANKAESLLPYPVENGKLTDAGWKQAIADIQSYSENQSNGYRGDGQKLVRPGEDIGVSLPAENPNYTPKTISEPAMNFANLVQGLNPPETGRVQKGLTPGNVKGQLLAEVNKKQPMTPAVIKPENVTKQSFKGFEPRTVKETNPLRNELAARGVKVRELTEVTERLAVEDIASVKPRADINFKAPVTDVIRAGFLPKDRPVAETVKTIESATPEEWQTMFGPQQSLTKSAYEVGLKLKSPEEVSMLKEAQERANGLGKAALERYKGGDEGALNETQSQGLKAQFFREAHEAATNTGSAAGAYGWRRMFPEGKPPFAQEGAKFLPRTEAGKKAAAEGYDIVVRGNLGIREAVILKDGHQVGRIASSSNMFTGDLTKVSINFADVKKNLRGKGLGEAAYRELFAQLKEDGVKEVDGITVDAAPLAIREKIFGKGSTEITDPEGLGSERGNLPAEQAKQELNEGGLGFNAKNKITSETNFLPKADKGIQDLAADYAKTAKIPYRPTGTYAPLNPKLGEKLADFYDSAKSNPSDPAVKKSYQALADETLAQYQAMTDAGYTIEPFQGEGEPYKNSDEAIADLRDNKHLYFLQTDKTFGKGNATTEAETKNPMLADSGITINGQPLLVNDVFRAVHDFFGHGKEGYQFGPRGEFNAWRAHSEMYSPEAQGALAAETLAQNSWVNFGKHLRDENGKISQKGEEGFVPLSERPFGEQKSVVVPNELIEEAKASFLPKKRNVEVSDVQKRDKQYRPLTADGLIDYEKLYAEMSSKKKKDDAANDADRDKRIAKGAYKMPANAEKAGPATGWILPNQEFVPLDAAFHEQFLAENSADLNQRFGTKFGETADVSERLDALKGGFVRVRYTPNNGGINIELSASHWTPKVKRKVLDLLDAQTDKIDNLRVSLLDERGATVDTVGGSVVELEGAERFDALSKTVGSLRGSAKFLPRLPDKPGWGYVGEANSEEVIAKAVHLGRSTHEGLGLQPMWRYNPRTKKIYWWKSEDRDAFGENVQSELEASGHEVDGTRMMLADPYTYNAAHAKFLPSEEGTLPGMKLPSVARVQQDRVKARVNKAKDKFPEALPPKYEKDDAGKFVMDEDGKPKPVLQDYRFDETPVAREAAKGLRGEEREDAVTTAIAEKLVKATKVAQKNPSIQAGSTWYSTARTRLKKLLGDDTKLFSELLGATSARTPVETNFRFSLDAYNQFKRGAYDDILKKYREGKARWESGETDGFPTRAAFMDAWVKEHNLTPVQSNGKKFAMNSQAVLKVLDGSWAKEVVGPKTPNFAGNLSGDTFEATIDVWASRLIHRLANEGNDKPWRILPENETGLSDADFALGQKIFRKAADKLGMKPDALQAILWFAEKDHWEKNGWTRGAGAEKSDFNSLLKETELTPSGVLKRKTPQGEFNLYEDDIQPKKK